MNLSPNIYYYNFLKSTNSEFNSDDTFLISRIINFNNPDYLRQFTISEIAEKLHNVFKMSNSPFWQNTDRICLATRFFATNNLHVVSSFQTNRLKPTSLNPGYNCYVKEESSILKIKNGEIRIFSNIDLIINSFNESKTKPQKSIYLLYQAGVKSGISIPLVFENKIQGYLFFNSINEGAFDEIRDQDYSILCLIQNIFCKILSEYNYQHLKKDHQENLSNIDKKNTIVGDLYQKQLKQSLQKYLKTQNVELKINSSIDSKFLLSPTVLSHYLLHAFDQVDFTDWNKKITVNLNSVNKCEIICEVYFDDHSKINYSNSNKSIFFSNCNLTNLEACILLTISAEENKDNLNYSTF